MIHLSAFADEISADLDQQIAVLDSEHIHHLDLRSVWQVNVLDLTDQQATNIKEALDAHGIGVAAIGSPVGKVPIDSAWDEQLQRFERAIELARFFGAQYIRIFSFYAPIGDQVGGGTIDRFGQWQDDWRDEVLRRLEAMTKRAKAAGIVLLHENEKDIYGDTIARCVDALASCNNAHLQAVFDPANFIQCGQQPYPNAYEALRPWLRYVHVKDARADGSVVAAGEGAARWPELLQQLCTDGYDGFFSLEPHLAAADKYQGFSGPALFRRASQALQGLLSRMGWEYA